MHAPHQSALDAALMQYSGVDGALLPILHHIQDSLGFVPPDTVPLIARALHLSTAQVHGVISFYHYFETAAPTHAQTVHICVAEACQARGAKALLAHCEGKADVQTTPIYCLGQCATGPSMLINGTLKARMNSVKFDACLTEAT